MANLGVLEAHDERRVLDEADTTVEVPGQLGHGPQVVLAVRLFHVPLHERSVLGWEVGDDVFDADAVVEELERPHARIAGESLA